MSQFEWIVVAWVVIYFGLRLIQPLIFFVQVLRTPIGPARIRPLSKAPQLGLDQQASVDELESLGFQIIAWVEVENGVQKFDSALLRHATEPAFAGLDFMIGNAGYSITFYSVASDGTLLVTGNRRRWASPFERANTALFDAYAETLAGHWETHASRLSDAVRVSDSEAVQRINSYIESYFDDLREKHALTQLGDTWYPTLKTAARIAWAWARAKSRLKRPYRSQAIDGEYQPAFAARYYQQIEAYRNQRGKRRDVKIGVLLVTLALSLIGWGLLFNWEQAIALVAILLVHEGGHALAMRIFGYRDMTMLFMPMLGALVTGSPKKIAAWKQIVILLAGPIPGLLVGVGALIYLGGEPHVASGFNWDLVAYMAVLINLFNLLPIYPLDGGQLVNVALLSRWPRARLFFHYLSVAGFVAFALLVKAKFIWVIVLLVALSTPSQQRITRLRKAWHPDVDENEQLPRMFELAGELLKGRPVVRQIPLVRAVLATGHIRPARIGEGVLVLLIMLGVWSGVAVVAIGKVPFSIASANTEVDNRTQAQRDFDRAYYNYLDSDDDSKNALLPLDRRARALRQDDPRRVDLAVLHTYLMKPKAQGQALEKIIERNRNGLNYDLPSIARILMSDIEMIHASPSKQLADKLMHDAEHISTVSPAAYSGTIPARLKAAEAYDIAGDVGKATSVLKAINRRIESSCSTGRAELINARAWFEIAHKHPTQAVSLIERSACAGDTGRPYSSIAITYAWGLLAAGRIDDGVKQMRLASYGKAYTPSILRRLHGVRARPPRLLKPLDMAYALKQAGKLDEMRHLITRRNKWVCSYHKGKPLYYEIKPWQESRENALRDIAKAICRVSQRSP